MAERTYKLAVIGTGAMGKALIKGLIDAKVFKPHEIVASDINKSRLEAFREEIKVEIAENIEAASRAEIILLAVKPMVIVDVLKEVSAHIKSDQMVISIAAGVTIRRLQSELEPDVPVIRAMPNTPCMVRAGAIAISRGSEATDDHIQQARAIFGAVGRIIEVPERAMDAVTGLSGSGPAYIFVLIEALSDAGVKAGLTRNQAEFLAVQTVFGAAKMVMDIDKHPAELKDAVTSPGGTTIAGLAALERAAFRASIVDAVEAAAERSSEIAEEYC
jgi:pyrroline-5-carboxylate reductase